MVDILVFLISMGFVYEVSWYFKCNILWVNINFEYNCIVGEDYIFYLVWYFDWLD